MKKFLFLALLISSSAFSQEIKTGQLSPQEANKVQNKIETPIFSTDKKGEPKLGAPKNEVKPQKNIHKKKRKRMPKKA